MVGATVAALATWFGVHGFLLHMSEDFASFPSFSAKSFSFYTHTLDIEFIL